MSDFNIPMSMAPQAASVNTKLPLTGETNLPLKMQAFSPIDANVAAEDAYRLADRQEEFKEKQSVRLEKQAAREEQARDRQQLEMLQKAGLNLTKPDDISKAITLLEGKVSDTTMQNLSERHASSIEKSAKMQDVLQKMDSATIATGLQRQSEAVTIMEGALNTYEESLKTKGEAGAAVDFAASKKAIVQMLANEKNPITQAPMYSPAILQKMESLSPDQLKAMYQRTVQGRDEMKDAAEIKRKEAISLYEKEKISTRKEELLMKQKKLLSGGVEPTIPDDTALRIAQDVAIRGKDAMPTNIGRGVQGAANLLKIENKLTEVLKDTAPGDRAAAIANYNAAKNELNTIARRQGNIETAVIETGKFADLALKTSKKVWRTGFKPLNQIIEFGAEKLLSPEQAEFVVANTSLVKAYGIAAGRGSTSVTAEKYARDMLYTAADAETYARKVAQLQKEVKAIKESPEEALSQVSERIKKMGGEKAKEPAASPAGFPKVTTEEQKKRDAESVVILNAELADAQNELKAAKTPEDKATAEKNVAALQREIKAKSGSAETSTADKLKTGSIFKPISVEGFKGVGSKAAPYMPTKNEDLAQLKQMRGAYYMRADDPNNIYQVP